MYTWRDQRDTLARHSWGFFFLVVVKEIPATQ
jgi:hypothetical protein